MSRLFPLVKKTSHISSWSRSGYCTRRIHRNDNTVARSLFLIIPVTRFWVGGLGHRKYGGCGVCTCCPKPAIKKLTDAKQEQLSRWTNRISLHSFKRLHYWQESLHTGLHRKTRNVFQLIFFCGKKKHNTGAIFFPRYFTALSVNGLQGMNWKELGRNRSCL
jgi:hypothetical protein